MVYAQAKVRDVRERAGLGSHVTARPYVKRTDHPKNEMARQRS
jgi:hypothetical protein